MTRILPLFSLVPLCTLGLISCQEPKSASTKAAEPESGDIGNTIPGNAGVIPAAGEVLSQKLAERETGEATIGFTELSAAATGVSFINPIKEDHPLKLLYATEKVCGGVAVGDVNGDGLPDLYFTSGPEKNRLFVQTGKLEFEDQTERAGVGGPGYWSAGATMVDIDGDDDLDIMVANYSAPNEVYLNRGDGTFEEKAKELGLDVISASHMPTFCDYDRDGDLDLYLLVNRFHSPKGRPMSSEALRFRSENGVMKVGFSDPELSLYFEPYQDGEDDLGRPIFKLRTKSQSDLLYRNDGGKFTAVNREAGIAGKGMGLSATWWDFNGDNWPDLWVGNDFDSPDRIYRNNGDGTFTDVVKSLVPHTSWFSMGSDFGDLNGDALPDFLIADMSGTNHFKQKVNMGSMSGKNDFLRNADPQQYMRNALFLNTGTDRFQEAAHLAGLANSDWTWSIHLSDFDCDAQTDVFMTNGMSKNFNESDNMAVIVSANETEWDRHVTAGTARLKEANLAFRNKGDLVFENVGEKWGLDHVGMSFGSVHADLDRDGDLDLVVCHLEEPASIYRNDFNSGHRTLIQLHGQGGNRAGVGAKLRLKTASGKMLIRQQIPVRGYQGSHESLVHFGLGEESEPFNLVIEWPSGHVQSLELEANHLHQIAEPAGSAAPITKPKSAPLFVETGASGIAHQENDFDDFSKQPLLPNQLSRLGPGQAWGDFDNDGDADLWAGGAAGLAGYVWANDGNGKFEKKSMPALVADARSEDMGALWFDLDADGDLDLYVVSGGYEFEPGSKELEDRVYLNDGGMLKRSSKSLEEAPFFSGSTVNAADFDRDGDLDLFVGGRVLPGAWPSSVGSRILVNEKGRLGDHTAKVAASLEKAGMVTSALWSDVNGDGWIDLLVTREWGTVMILMNREGVLEEATGDTGIANLTGWWNGIAGRDLDADGDIDYVVTNFGKNAKYHPTKEKPVSVYYGDFEGTGRKRIVEAEFENDTLYPVRGRSCSTSAMPHLAEKFTSFKQFAVAGIPDIYSKESLTGSLKLSVNTLASGVLMNRSQPGGEPRFEFLPFPRIAQVAPSFGVVIGDYTGDGVMDVYLAQNFYSPQVETGRMAGGVGQLLKGRGDGEFDPVPPHESGLVVSGDAASLCSHDLDQDGRLDLVVGVNDGSFRFFKRSSGPKNLTITLRADGQAGNQRAIGAAVTLIYDDQTTASAEITAGGSYLSQSISSLVFPVLPGRRPQTVRVIWPDHTGSEHQVTDVTGQMVITRP